MTASMTRLDWGLQKACRKGDLAVVCRFCTKLGVDKNKADSLGLTAMHEACAQDHAHVVDWLVNHGAAVDVVNAAGESPFLFACRHGSLRVAALLVAAGADLERGDSAGRTPFFWACARGHADVVGLLVHAGVDEDTGGSRVGRATTPFRAACQQARCAVVLRLVEAEC